MPYVDSALLLPLGTSLLFLLWISLCGAALVRFCCSIRSWTLLPPLGLAAGCAIFLVCANLVGKVGALPEGSGIAVLVGRVGTVPLAFGAAFLAISALGVYASIRLWPRSWQLPSRHSLLAVCGYSLLALVLAYVCLAIRNQSYFYDFPTHLAFATTIARDNLPVRNPYSPVSPSGYHYGAALLVAALSRGAGLPAVTGYQLLAALQGAAFLLLVFALGREAGKHFLWGLACLLAALSMGSLVLWWPFAALPPALSHLLGGNLSLNALLQFPSLRKYIELVYPIVSFSSDLHWLLIYPHRLAAFFTVAALAVLLVGPGRRRWGHTTMALSIAIAAAVALYDETMLPLALMALAWPLLSLRRNPLRFAIWVGGLFIAIGLIVFQGGSVTDALLGATGSRPPFSLYSPAEFSRSLAFTKVLPEGWLWILPPLPLAASALIFTWKRWWLGLMLCGFGFAGYLGFHLLHFQGVAGTGEFARVVNLSFLALALTAPLAVARLLREAPWWRTGLVSLLLLPVALPTLLQPVASVLSELPREISLHDPDLPGLAYTPQITDPYVHQELVYFRDAYRDVGQLLPDDSVVLTRHPVSFAIATGLTTAYAPTSGLTLFPSHRYIPDPAFYDAFWRLDPAAWRALGATAVLYRHNTYYSLPPAARRLVEDSGWFITHYDENEFLLLTPSEAFFRYETAPPSTFASFRAALTPRDTVFLSPNLPYGVGQALVHLLSDHPVAGLGPDPSSHDWMELMRPPGLDSASAVWYARSHIDTRLAGVFPEAALWEWRAPSESVGVYPNAPVPAFAPLELSAGQLLALQANHSSLVLDDAPGMATSVHFRSLSLVLAGRPGSVVQICAPAGCAQRDLGGATWTYSLPLTAENTQFTLSVLHGRAFVAGTLGYADQLTAARTTGVVIQPRQTDNAIEVVVSYFNFQGWTLGNGVAWQLVRVVSERERRVLSRPSQLIIFGELGDVVYTLGPDGSHAEHNFTESPPLFDQARALPDGEYRLFLSFFIDHFRAADRIPTAHFRVQEGTIVSFTPLPQIARLSFSAEHTETVVLEE